MIPYSDPAAGPRRAKPERIRTIEDLHDHLQAAVELEHSTIPPYLCALYSIRPGRNPEAVEIIRTVAVQEMLHMVLAANILNAVGGVPTIDAPDFVPDYPATLPIGSTTPLVVDLRKFSHQALETFLAIEKPAPSPPKKAMKGLMAAVPVPPGQLVEMIRRGQIYPSIGDFYEAIENGMVALEQEARARGGTIFTGDPARQVGPEQFYGAGGHIIPVTDMKTATAALDLIVWQGEGFEGGIGDQAEKGDGYEIAHYYRFQEIVLGRKYNCDDQPDHPTGDSFTVDWSADAVHDMIDNPKLSVLGNGEVHARGREFAAAYTGLLKTFQTAFDGTPAALERAVVTMFDLKRMAMDLMSNPVPGSEHNGGPCFEYVAD